MGNGSGPWSCTCAVFARDRQSRWCEDERKETKQNEGGLYGSPERGKRTGWDGVNGRCIF